MNTYKALCCNLTLLAGITSAGSAAAACLFNNTQSDMNFWYAPMNEGDIKKLPAGQKFCDDNYSGTFRVWLMDNDPPLMAGIKAKATDTIQVKANYLVVIDKNGNEVAQSILSPPYGGGN